MRGAVRLHSEVKAPFATEQALGRWRSGGEQEAVRPMGNLVRVLLSVLLPPLGVFLKVGLGGQFWLNILLTILGYLPGVVHAVWIIARRA